MRNRTDIMQFRDRRLSGLTFIMSILMLFIPVKLLAQTDTILNNHLIIAFDNALPDNYKNYLVNSRRAIINGVEKLLSSTTEQPLKRGDYVSVVNFVIGTDNKSLDDFVSPSIDNSGKEITWKKFDTFDNLFNGDWADMVYNQGINRAHGGKFSLLSGAKAYSVKVLHGKNITSADDILAANRTWLLMVSDDFHNGNDNFTKEFQIFKGMGARADEKTFRDLCNYFSRNYIVEYINDVTLSSAGQLPYRLILYRIRPSATTSLAGVVDYPASLNLKRVPGGYSIEFNASSVDSLYTLVKMQIDVTTSDNKILSSIATPHPDGNPLHLSLNIGHDEIDPEHVDVTIRGWLKQNDKIYDAHVWNPYDPAASRLVSRSTLTCDDNGTVFGLPLSDSMWWFYRTDIRMAAFIWEVIFILLIIIAVVFIVIILNKRSLRYTPSNSEFSIRRAEDIA